MENRTGKIYRGAVGLKVRIPDGREIAERRQGWAMRWAYHSVVAAADVYPRVALATLGRPVAMHGEPSGFVKCV